MIKYISIGNTNIDNSKKKYMKNDYKKTIEQLSANAEKNMDNEVYYLPIEEVVQNVDLSIPAKSIKFRITQDEENFEKHFFEIVMPVNNSQIMRPLIYGDKNAILRYLKNPDSMNNILEQIKQMNQDLRSNR